MRHIWTIVLLLIGAGTIGSVLAGSIDTNDASINFDTSASSLQDQRAITAPLFDFMPFIAHGNRIVPGFADPLGMGVDPHLKVFSGRVYFMDVLGDFNTTKPTHSVEIEMPRGTVRANDLLGSFLARYLSRERAFDESLFNLSNAEVIERNGLPVTTETVPLSLAGFGSVNANQKPFYLHWMACSAQDKRLHTMAESKRKKRGACSAKGVCVCSNI